MKNISRKIAVAMACIMTCLPPVPVQPAGKTGASCDALSPQLNGAAAADTAANALSAKPVVVALQSGEGSARVQQMGLAVQPPSQGPGASLSAQAARELMASPQGQFAFNLFAEMLEKDPDAFGFLRTQGALGAIVEGGRFTEMDQNLLAIHAFFNRIYPVNGRTDGTMILNGIGGQTTTSVWFEGTRPMPAGREFLVLDSLGTDYLQAQVEDLANKLRTLVPGGAPSLTPISIDAITYPVVWAASSKSGSTDETMANFQSTFNMLIRAYAVACGFSYEDTEALLKNIFNLNKPSNIWELNSEQVFSGVKDQATARAILKKIFSSMVFTTDHNPGKEPDSWASRLTAFRHSPLVIDVMGSADAIASMHIPRDLGGRYNGIGANALVIAQFMGMNIDAIASTALSLNPTLRARTPEANPFAQVAALLSLAGRQLTNGNKMEVVVNDPALLRSAEALVQLLPETLGKNAAGDKASGAYGIFPVARVRTEAMTDLEQKIVLVINTDKDAAGNATVPVKLTADHSGDLVITLTLPDTSEASIARLVPVMEYLAMMTSIFNEADFHARNQTVSNLADPAASSALLGQAGEKGWVYSKWHDALSGALQAGVQKAKNLVKKAGLDLFNPEKGKTLAPDGKTELPVRDFNTRWHWYTQRLLNPGFQTREWNLGNGENVERVVKGRNLVIPAPARAPTDLAGIQDEKIAQQLAALKLFARENNRLLDFWAYTQRSPALDELKAHAEACFADLMDPAPQVQHQRAQMKVLGDDATVAVIMDFSRSLERVMVTEPTLVWNGTVPTYLHGLTPSEVSAMYAEQYSLLLSQELASERRYSTRLLFPDINDRPALDRMKAIFTRAAQIYQATVTSEHNAQQVQSAA